MRPVAFADDEYVRLLDDNERIFHPSKYADERIAAAAPSPADMHAELRHAVKLRANVEFMETRTASNFILLEAGLGSLQCEVRAAYAIVRIGGMLVAAKADVIRGRILTACRLLGDRVGAAAAAMHLPTPTVRFWPDAYQFPAFLANDENAKVGALLDSMHDEAIVRLRALYFVAPPGPERVPRPLR